MLLGLSTGFEHLEAQPHTVHVWTRLPGLASHRHGRAKLEPVLARWSHVPAFLHEPELRRGAECDCGDTAGRVPTVSCCAICVRELALASSEQLRSDTIF